MATQPAAAAQAATKPSLTVKRRLKAPPAKVFAAWTDPEKVKGWMGPGEVKVLKVECDPRVGGRYRWLMQSPAGEEHDVSGVTANSCRIRSSSSLGPGNRRRSVNRW
jgi:uncharacterized protein YndB with AHSA1/START domain